MSDSRLTSELDAAQQRIKELEAELASVVCECPPTLQELAFENAPGGMAVVSLKGKVMICNREGTAMLGYSGEDLAEIDTGSLYTDPAEREGLRNTLLEGQTIRGKELRVNCKDGSILWVSLNARPIQFEGENAALMTFVNITSLKEAQQKLDLAQGEFEHKVRVRTSNLETANEDMAILNLKLIKRDRQREQAQQALRESEERFRAIFENKHVIMLLIEPTTGEIKDANPAAQAYYGYSIDTLKTMSMTDINTLTPDKVKDAMREAREEKRDYFIFRHRLASGEIRDVEVFSGPVLIHDQQLLYSIVHDITERKRAEESLLWYQRIFASTPDLISLVDRNYVYRLVNNAYLETFGKKQENIIGTSVRTLVGKKFFEERSKPILDKAFSGETVRETHSLTAPGKAVVHLAVTYHPVRSNDGSIDFVSIDARDVTSLKENEEALKVFSDRLALATDAGKIGIWEWDVTTDMLIWDEMMMELYKIKPAEFSGTFDAWLTRIHPEDRAATEQLLHEAMTQNKPFEGEFRIVLSDGEIRYVKAAALIQFSDGKAIRITGINRNITKTRKLEEELRRLATTDPLTGASNRRYFMDRAHEEIERARRQKAPLSLLSLDIDHFKKINDTYGHPVGDKVLKALVNICKTTLRVSDTFARMGGEEFSAILPATDLEASKLTAERLRVAVEQSSVVTDEDTITYTISLGVAQLDDKDDSIEDLMRRADDALYKAKESGRNRVETE